MAVCSQISDDDKWKNFLVNILAKNLICYPYDSEQNLESRLINYTDREDIFVPVNLIGRKLPNGGCIHHGSHVAFRVTSKHLQDYKNVYDISRLTNHLQVSCENSVADPNKFVLVVKDLSVDFMQLFYTFDDLKRRAGCTNPVLIVVLAQLKIKVEQKLNEVRQDIIFAAPIVEIRQQNVKPCANVFSSDKCVNDAITKYSNPGVYKILRQYLNHALSAKYDLIRPFIQAKLSIYLPGPALKVLKTELTDLLSETSLVESRGPVIGQEQTNEAVKAYAKLLDRANQFPLDALRYHAQFSEYNSVVNYLRMAIITRIGYLKDSVEYCLITDVSDYIDFVSQDLNAESLTNERFKFIEKQKQNYAKEINRQIDEGVNLIEEVITPVFGELEKKFKANFEGIVSETQRLSAQTNVRIEQLKQKQEEAGQNLILTLVCSYFKFVGTVLGKVLPGAGPIVEFSIDTTVDVAHAGLKYVIGDTQALNVSIPKGVGRLRKRETDETEAKEAAEAAEDVVKKEIEAHKKAIEDKKKKNENKVKSLENACKDVMEAVNGVSTYLKSNRELIEQLEEAKKQLQTLEEFMGKINNDVIPFVQLIVKDMETERSSMGNRSRIALEVKQWKIKDVFADLSHKLEKLSEGFPQQEEFQICVQKYSEAMAIMMKVFDHIQAYEEKKQFSEYVAGLHIQNNNNHINYKDEELRQVATKLQDTLQKTIALKNYKTAMNAFKQFVFPLADHYLKNMVWPAVIEQTYRANTEDLLTNAMLEMNYLTKEFNAYKKSIQAHDRYLGVGEFQSKYVSGKPFYAWQPDKHRKALDGLLQGKEVYFFANITDSLCKQDAIKINRVDFSIKANSNSEQKRLADLLKSFQLSATHLGNNYYRFRHQYFLIETAVQNIWYTFEVIENENKPVHTSSAYDKISNGDFMLSPFAMWKLQLTNATENANFNQLRSIRGGIHLELGGRGFYIDLDKVRDEEINVLPYYKDNFVPDLTLKNAQAFKNQQRHKRSAVGPYATNSAAHGLSSPINYLCNLVKESVMNFRPLQRVKTLFSVDSNGPNSVAGDHSFNKLNSAVFNDYAINDELLLNVNAPTGLINNEFNKDQGAEFGSLNLANNQNLALLSFAVNKYTKAKCSSKKLDIDDLVVNEQKNQYAQMLAYSAQAAKFFN